MATEDAQNLGIERPGLRLSLSRTPGSLRRALMGVGLPAYEAIGNPRLLYTHSLTPPERQAIPRDLQLIAVTAFALDTIPTFADCSVWEKYVLLLDNFHHIQEDFFEMRKMFLVPPATATSVIEYAHDPTNMPKRRQLETASRIGTSLLAQGYEIKHLGLYRWLHDALLDPTHDLDFLRDLAGKIPQELLPEDVREMHPGKRSDTMNGRLWNMAYKLVEIGIVPKERIDRTGLRKAANTRALTANLERMRATGQHMTMDELAEGTTLTSKSGVEEYLGPLRRSRHELHGGKKEGIQEALDSVNKALGALATADTPEARAKVTIPQIIDYLEEQRVVMSYAQIRGYYIRYRDELRVGQKRAEITPDLVAEMKRLSQEEGLSSYQIAERLGVKPSTVQKRLKSN